MRLYGELHRFIPVLAAGRGFKVGELVINHRPRKFGHSKYGVPPVREGVPRPDHGEVPDRLRPPAAAPARHGSGCCRSRSGASGCSCSSLNALLARRLTRPRASGRIGPGRPRPCSPSGWCCSASQLVADRAAGRVDRGPRHRPTDDAVQRSPSTTPPDRRPPDDRPRPGRRSAGRCTCCSPRSPSAIAVAKVVGAENVYRAEPVQAADRDELRRRPRRRAVAARVADGAAGTDADVQLERPVALGDGPGAGRRRHLRHRPARELRRDTTAPFRTTGHHLRGRLPVARQGDEPGDGRVLLQQAAAVPDRCSPASTGCCKKLFGWSIDRDRWLVVCTILLTVNVAAVRRLPGAARRG